MKTVDPNEIFANLSDSKSYFPACNSSVQFTEAMHTPYFQTPGVVMLARPSFDVAALRGFLAGFAEDLEFAPYTEDTPIDGSITDRYEINVGASLIKTAGQLCYMSFGPGHTKNAGAQKYLDNIMASGHGSVLEHAQYSFLIYGADRAFTHELVRHRTGVAFSQQSQRYVDGKTLRFVERPEYQKDPELHAWFRDRIDRAKEEYNAIAEALIKEQAAGNVQLSGEKRTEMRKKVNQAARSCLPNETEAPIVFSGNIRALRHVCEMRANGLADVPIREVTTRIFLCMRQVEPLLFNDYKLLEMPDGTFCVSTDWRKV